MANGQSNRNAAGHYSNIPGHDGLSLVSVTTVLQAVGKPQLIAWSAKVERKMVLGVAADLYDSSHGTPKMQRMAYLDTLSRLVGKQRAGDKFKQKAGEVGKRLHALTEYALLKELGKAPPKAPALTPDIATPWGYWEEWRAAHGFKPRLVEQMVYSLTHGYAGTLDCMGELDGSPCVLDWKTGKDIYHEAYLQASAYRMALIEMGHAGRDCGGAIVLFPKTADEQFKMVKLSPSELDEQFEVFLAVKELWKWQDGYEQKRKAAWEAGKAPADVQGSPAPTPAEMVVTDIKREETADIESDSPEELWK